MAAKSRFAGPGGESDLAESIRVVWEMYNAFGRGDLEGIIQHVAEDVVWELVGPETIPFAGVRRGIDGVREFFLAMNGCVEYEEFSFDEFIAQGERVVALGHSRARVIATGKRYAAKWVHIFSVRDGKVHSFREQTDTAAIVAAMMDQPAEAPAASAVTQVSVLSRADGAGSRG